MTVRPLLAGLSLLLTVTGCAKQRECTEALGRLNSSSDRLEKTAKDLSTRDLNSGDHGSVVKSAKMSELLSKAAKEEAANLGEVKITTEELKRSYDAYIKMLHEAAAAAHNLSVATAEVASLIEKIEASETQFKAAMDAFKKACAKGQPECAAVSEVLSKSPDAKDEVKLAAGLREWIKKLDAVDPKDEAVKAAVGGLRKVLTSQIDFLEKAPKAHLDAEAAAKALDKAVAPEDKLIDAMNKTCGAG